jgi:hypothetical protein
MVAEGVLDRCVADELLVHLFETDDVFVLNGDARIVFEALKQSSSIEEVRDFVATRVFCDAVELSAAVDRAVEQMVGAGLIVRIEEPNPKPERPEPAA